MTCHYNKLNLHSRYCQSTKYTVSTSCVSYLFEGVDKVYTWFIGISTEIEDDDQQSERRCIC